jgi:glutamate N-acetyltransferase/amino-acid N-acetyltransferase
MEWEGITGGLCAVKGVRAYGIKEGNNGLALIEGRGKAVGMFTSNKITAAPVLFTRKQLEKGEGIISAIIANSGCANSFTGENGMRNAEKMAELASSSLGIDKKEVAVASTGPIGRQVDMGLIERQLGEVAKRLTSDEVGSMTAAKAIMTTDTFHKERAISTGDEERVTIGGIAKGSGMIFPHLATATMLSFIYTDGSLDDETLKRCLKDAVDNSFNMVVVDGDMSTNDMVLLVSTGRSGKISEGDFKEGLNLVCKELAKLIARDGEGATKFVEVRVKGTASVEDAREIARAIVRSPLVKSAIFGERIDLTCGRIIATIGSSSGDVDPDRISISIKGEGQRAVLVARKGKFVDLSGATRDIMKGKEIFIEVNIGMGEREATAWGCDLSYDYVQINAG